MKRKNWVIATLFLGFCGNAVAQDNPLWLRHNAISPDGSTIAFCYKGDIFTVPVAGGRASQLTSNASYDTCPVWSPDGKKIAFASDREGSLDIYWVSKDGGTPVRLTTGSGTEMPVAFRDSEHLLYLSNVRPSVESMQFPSGQFSQVYEVSLDGGKSRMVSSLPMENIAVSADGKRWLYQDAKGYEDSWRKHHTSSIARDIWEYSPEDGTYRKLTAFAGEDRNPVWGDNGEFYYLSEEKGSFNVFCRKVEGGSPVQLTRFATHPVRFLTRAENGLLCFSYDGELYTLKAGEEPRKVDVQIVSDSSSKDLVRRVLRSGVTDFAVSPDGKEVAFVLRGDVYVTSVEYNTTRQITDTPDQERDVDFAPDGRAVIYASERKGLWQIYRSSIVRKEEKQMTYATELKEECLTQTDQTSFQPKYSPDGKEVAYLENRTTLRVINLKSREIRTVMDGKYEYSYSDGDQAYAWSPDSKWILSQFIGVGGWNNTDIVLLNADGKGEMHNLTESGYSDGNPKWVLDGKAMIWESDRAGFRSHGSWGAESDIYIMFFDLDAYERFLMSKEDLALAEEAEKAEKDKKDKAEKDSKEKKGSKTKKGKDKKDGEEKEDVKPLVFDLKNARDRVVRLTVNSSRLGDAVLSKKGDVLYYVTSFEGSGDLWKHDLKEDKTEIVQKGVGYGALVLDKDGKNLFLQSRGGIKKIEVGRSGSESVEFEAMFNHRPAEERAYIFDHVWRQVNEKFYDPKIHGIDWEGYRKAYERFLPYINNNYDFAELLSEMLGELNASHTGARYRSGGSSLSVASLGLFYDDTYDGSGVKIKEIISKGPLTRKKNEITPGYVIEKIDGVSLETADLNYLLAGKVNKRVRLSVISPAGKRSEVVVKAISNREEQTLLYQRWVERNRAIVDSLSDGRLGYIHIEGMDSKSFRTLYSELLGRYRNREAVIIDTRHNGGGWLHDDVITLLGAKEYQRFMPRGQYIGSDPYNKWTKPSCMLVCEDNYSNAHGTPWLYKELKIGKLIGTPVPGTMTAVWWETQIDPSLVFGIPQVGCMDMRGNYMENQQLDPDILIYNDPADVLRGKDAQLEGAIKEMLSQINQKKQ